MNTKDTFKKMYYLCILIFSKFLNFLNKYLNGVPNNTQNWDTYLLIWGYTTKFPPFLT
jgi:hypothetical protein